MPRTVPCSNYFQARPLSRRELIRAGGLSLFGLSLPQLLARRGLAASDGPGFGRAKSCILLFMWGGPAQQDTWDMKPDAPAEFRGEFQSIATKTPGLRICEHLPLLAQRSDKLALVRTLTHSNADHTTATHFLLTGQPPPAAAGRSAEWPGLGSMLAKLGRPSGALPPTVTLRPEIKVNGAPRFVEQSRGQFGGWLGPVYDPFIIDQNPSQPDYRVGEFQLPGEVSLGRFRERRELLSGLDRLQQRAEAAYTAASANHRRAFDLLTSAAGQNDAFQLEAESQATRQRYGMNAHGQSVLQARRLVERGVPLVTVFWPNDGLTNVSVYWDTHSRNFIDLRERLLPAADQAFSALLDDLHQRGLLDETLVVWTGEFGRTPRIGQRNSDAGAGADGRDHWPGCFSAVLAGAGIQGGSVYGRSDKVAAYPASDPVAPSDFVATIFHLLGVPANASLEDSSGRPHIIRPGRVLGSLLA